MNEFSLSEIYSCMSYVRYSPSQFRLSKNDMLPKNYSQKLPLRGRITSPAQRGSCGGSMYPKATLLGWQHEKGLIS